MTTEVCSEPTRTYFPVRTGLVPFLAGCSLAVYLRDASGGGYRLYRGAHKSLRPNDLVRLSEAGVTTVHLEQEEYSRFQTYLRTSLDAIVDDEKLPVSQRLGLLNEVVRDVLRDTFRWGNVNRAVEATGKLADHVVSLIDHEDFITSELGSVLHFDYGTFTHSANVAVYSVLLARSLGHTNRELLRRIGVGALLHDIGKLAVPEGLITKPAALSPDEKEIVQSHAAQGLMKLREVKQLEFGQLMMAYQHHERIDGSGYPVHNEGSGIHEWARICAVADVFEALTSQRPYRRPFSKAAALAFMQENVSEGLDREILECWTKTISGS